MNKHFTIVIALMFVMLACHTEDLVEKGSPEYIKEINEWHAKREAGLKLPNGWLNLVGLFWLEEGENTIGSANTNSIIFPKNAPAQIGVISKSDSIIYFASAEGIDVTIDGQKVSHALMQPDVSGEPTTLELGTLRWFIIKRGEKFGIRLRDLEAPLVKEFAGIERFPVNEDWKITAKFVPYNPPKKISIPTILGTVEEAESPGSLNFEKNGKNYSIDPTAAGDGFFIIFADETSGVESYGAGRFLYVDAPDENGNVTIDFNRAYNPPCAFTKYATCPLPPRQNHLHLRVTAGEKKYGDH